MSGDHSSIKTFVERIFEGVLTNETKCLNCETVIAPSIFLAAWLHAMMSCGVGQVTSKDETFLDLSLDIEENSSITRHCGSPSL